MNSEGDTGVIDKRNQEDAFIFWDNKIPDFTISCASRMFFKKTKG